MRQTEIRIRNARSHNLKGVSCRIPLGRLTVVTGVSGSGKSSLAFDTLYAEGQRRYVSSLSTYARQFLERLPRPEVDAISNLPPAIAIEQRNTVTNARSTVGTATEILDHLRLLFARVGATRCAACGSVVARRDPSTLADTLLHDAAGKRITVAAPLPDPELEPDAELHERLLREGYRRLMDAEGAILDLDEIGPEGLARARGDAALVVDRLAIPEAAAPDPLRARLAEALGEAFGRGGGDAVVAFAGEGGVRTRFREGFRCDDCGRAAPPPVPALFSFDSPLGACPSCEGFGRLAGIDWERVVPDPSRSLEEGAIAPFQTRMGRHMQRDLVACCREEGVPVDLPFESLDERSRHFVLAGDEDQGGDWYGVGGFFRWLERRRYRVQARTTIARYRRFDTCPDCEGTRLQPEARRVDVAGRSIADVARDGIAALRGWLEGLALDEEQAARGGRLLETLRARVETVDRVGLGYVALDRPTRTLSGGEAQRIQLATALGGRLTSSLYVLDEPSIGLHPEDADRLVAVLEEVRDHGNTLVVVEHAPGIVSRADHLIDLGPAAGRHGGSLVAEGTVDEVAGHQSSATARALRGELRLEPREKPRPQRGALQVRGAREHNLANLDVEFPLGQLVVVTGVSGAGKSTLVQRVLVANLLAAREEAEAGQRGEAGECDGIDGSEAIESVIVVDQSPASRSPRSNPATVSKVFDVIRTRFAETREARALGMLPGFFSFNVEGGRCDKCEGAGEQVIDMQFLDDVRVPCEACGGSRYRSEVLQVRMDGRTITEVLALTLDEACEAFAGDRTLVSRLEPFRRVGLGYLQLGQPLSTLSGGENQRVRLAQALARPGARRGRRAAPGTRLLVLDEPTTGLHPADVQVLMRCLDELVDGGDSVVLVEHDVDVILRADHVIDLGPEGGPGGGRIVASGPPREVADQPDSPTGRALARALEARGAVTR